MQCSRTAHTRALLSLSQLDMKNDDEIDDMVQQGGPPSPVPPALPRPAPLVPPVAAQTIVTCEVLSLHGVVTSIAVQRDALLSSLLQLATANEPPALASNLHLFFDQTNRQPELLSLISGDVINTVTVGDYLARPSAQGSRFSVVLRFHLRDSLGHSIPCLVAHATTFSSVVQHFLAIWHRRHQLPFDAGRTLVCYTDDSRSTEWGAVTAESLFMMRWLLHGAQSPLPVRVSDAAAVTTQERLHVLNPAPSRERRKSSATRVLRST